MKTFQQSFLLILIIIGGGLAPVHTQARQPVADSLIQWLDINQQMDTTRALNLAQISWALYRGYPDSSMIYSRESLRLSKELSFPRGEALANRYLGNAHFVMRNTDSALVYFERTLELFEELEDEQGISQMRASMGSIYAVNDQYDLAIQSFLEAIPAFEAQENPPAIAVMYNNIGNLYLEQDLYEEALSNYEKALSYLDDPRNPTHTLVYTNLTNAHYELNQFDEALEYGLKAVELINEYERFVRAPAVYIILGEIYLALEEYDESLTYYEEALKYSIMFRIRDRVVESRIYIARLKERKGEHSEARVMLEEALNDPVLSSTGNARLHKDALLLMARVERELGNFENSSGYALQANVMADSIYREEMALRISELETIYETEKRVAQIQLLEIENEVANLRSLIIGIMALVVIIFIVLGFWWYYRRKSEQKRIRMESMKSELQKYGLVISEKNHFISRFKDELDDVRRHVKTLEGRKELMQLVDSIHQNMNLTADEDELFNKINQVNAGFYLELRQRSDSLTEKDERLATLIQMDLNNKDIANILHIEPGSVKRAKTRLKKKLNLDTETDLNIYLKSLAA